MLFPIPFRSTLLLAGVLTLLTGHLPAAVSTDAATGARLLRAQLPSSVSPAMADCEQLSRAVVRAIYADRVHAPDILLAALGDGLDRKQPLRRSCKCVVHIFRNAAIVAPRQASGLLETAASLYPDCADALTEALDTLGDKNPVVAPDSKDRGASSHANDNDGPNTASGVNRQAGDPGDLNDRDLAGLGFGSGFDGSPGFPGAPGFVGSAPGGNIALPPPVVPPVTSVVNQ